LEITPEEFLTFSLELEEHHAVFYQLWQFGKPVFTDRVPTAGITFDRAGDWLEFAFNPDFWGKLDNYQRKFVVCHECLHVILNHGMRAGEALNAEAANVCLDIVINELLIRCYGFEREKLGFLNEKGTFQGCWVDTVFPDRKDLPKDEIFEFYFNQLPKIEMPGGKEGEGGKGGGLPQGFDDHSGLADSDWDNVVGKLNEELSPEEKETLRDLVEKHYEEDGPKRAGAGTGQWTFVDVKKVKRKKKWETVIKQWSKKYDRPELHDVEQWARLNRRFAMLGGNLMLPTEMEVEHDEEGKIAVWFFQDTSGSCWHLKERFFKAARSLDPARFDLRLFCFDTRVEEVKIDENKIYGGGGTSFTIIEKKIQTAIQQEGIKYPEAVFVITDGMGNRVQPEIPKRWYWFLSYNYRHCIPKECNTYDLRDYE
jgi:hypothetical protein